MSKKVPGDSESKPGYKERGGKAEESPRPGKFNHWGEEVLEVSVKESKNSLIVSFITGPVFVMADLLLPTKGVDPPVLGHHPALLRLGVHHAHQPRLLPQWVPSGQQIQLRSNCTFLSFTLWINIHFCESILAVERKLRLGMVESPSSSSPSWTYIFPSSHPLMFWK